MPEIVCTELRFKSLLGTDEGFGLRDCCIVDNDLRDEEGDLMCEDFSRMSRDIHAREYPRQELPPLRHGLSLPTSSREQ